MAEPAGTMGLKGWLWQNVGNASAMALLGVLFFIQSMDTRQQAREDRQMFREDTKANREDLRAAVQEMKRAIDHLDDRHQALKRDVDTLKTGGLDSFRAPAPREKGG